jgi:hypothetical protein
MAGSTRIGFGSPWLRGASAAAVVAAGLMLTPVAAGAGTGPARPGPHPAPGTSGCALGQGGTIKHVVYIQFDNTHFLRDTPTVPSDIEQIPALYNFMVDNGTVLTNDHTPLIAHTADDLVTSLTGEYGNEQGIPEANTYRYYNPTGKTSEAGSFGYWTDPVPSYATSTGRAVADRTPNMLTATGKNAPAPWVPYTRAGCNVGDVAMANMDLENLVPDIPNVFGWTSPQGRAALAAATKTSTTPAFVSQYEGLSVHCAQGATFCSGNPDEVTDLLPTEPGGYHGYKAVFGSTNLDGQLGSTGAPTNLTGQVIEGETGSAPGFPGYTGMQPTNALAYTLDMQEHGIPVTYTYITDAHTNASTGAGMGPGEATYEAQLAAYNKAFTTFFTRLGAAGINKTNTLFVFGEDENDHYAGAPTTTPGCNGVTEPCTYSSLGEVDVNLRGLLAEQDGITTAFRLHTDSAPFVYVTGQPARTSPTVRTLGRALATVTAYDPYKKAVVKLTNYLADPVEMQVLHMITADPARTPTLAMFATPDFYVVRQGASCTTSTYGTANCESIDKLVWNHGDLSPDINRSWMAFVGPDVQHRGITSNLWASETDTRPTLMALLGLRDDYTHEGRVLTPIIDPRSMSPALASPLYEQLAEAYTAIEQPVGPFGLATLTASTKGIASGTPGNDTVYHQTESRIAQLGAQRDRIGSAMIGLLENAAFQGRPIPLFQGIALIAQAYALIGQANHLAG